MVEDIKLQISLFHDYKIPTLPLDSNHGSSDIV